MIDVGVMEQLLREDEELTGLQLHVDNFRLVQVQGRWIGALVEDKSIRGSWNVRQEPLVGTWDKLNTGILGRNAIYCQPGRDVEPRLQRPVVYVLVPGYLLSTRLLVEEVGSP